MSHALADSDDCSVPIVLATTAVSHSLDRNSANFCALAPDDDNNSDDECACSFAKSLIDERRDSIRTTQNVDDVVCVHDRMMMNLQFFKCNKFYDILCLK